MPHLVEEKNIAMPKRLLTLLLLVLLAALAACTSTEPSLPGGDVLAPLPTDSGQVANETLPTLTELIAIDPNLVFFANSLNTAGLMDDLQSGGPYTVFAPSNAAFTEAGILVSQMDPALLGAIMDQHVVTGAFNEAELVNAGSVAALSGESLAVAQVDGEVKVDYALLEANVQQASNGTLYTINTLLLPPETGPEKSMWGVLRDDGRFTRFIAAIEGTPFMGTLRFGEAADAVLAPTDDAFAAMPANIAALLARDPEAMAYMISFHLLAPDGWPESADFTTADIAAMSEIPTKVPVRGSGAGYGFEKLAVSSSDEGLRIGEALVVTPDMDASNGSVHAIDTVLIPRVLLEDMP